MKKILVTGGYGRFANELKKSKTNIKFIYKSKKELNICNYNSITKTIKSNITISRLKTLVANLSDLSFPWESSVA